MVLGEYRPQLALGYRVDEASQAITAETTRESRVLHDISSGASVTFAPGISRDTPVGHFPRIYTFVDLDRFNHTVQQMGIRLNHPPTK